MHSGKHYYRHYSQGAQWRGAGYGASSGRKWSRHCQVLNHVLARSRAHASETSCNGQPFQKDARRNPRSLSQLASVRRSSPGIFVPVKELKQRARMMGIGATRAKARSVNQKLHRCRLEYGYRKLRLVPLPTSFDRWGAQHM